MCKKERWKERKSAKQTSPKELDTTNWTPTRLCKQGTGPQLSNCVQGTVFIGKAILRYDWGGGPVTLCDLAQCSCPCRSRDDDGGVMLVLVVLVDLGRQKCGSGYM